jgi:ATP-dependent Clp protease protease subunit
MATTPGPALPADVYAVFCSSIDQAAVQRLFAAVALASQKSVQRVHLLFQSTGGNVADGVCLYNFFKTAPVDITLYNVGSVQSVAAVAYLGARNRKTSARATFQFHRTTASPQGVRIGQLKTIAESVIADDARTESILREHLNISADKWAVLDRGDLWFTGDEAIAARIADQIAEFAPPAGSMIYSL